MEGPGAHKNVQIWWWLNCPVETYNKHVNKNYHLLGDSIRDPKQNTAKNTGYTRTNQSTHPQKIHKYKQK